MAAAMAWTHILPSYAQVPFTFETSFEKHEIKHWFVSNWTASFYYIAAYLITIRAISTWIQNSSSSKLELRRPLLFWNMGLALFSLLGTFRLLPELLNILGNENGYHDSVCDRKTVQGPVYTFWAWWFLMSKIPELGDTVFIALRKRPLTFLHVYHHCSVLCVSWYLGSEDDPTARWFITMNLFVHAIMYSYFALQILRIFVIPKAFAMAITFLQIAQMVIGVTVNLHAYRTKRRGEDCEHSNGAIYAAAALYFSYFLLFSWFFYNAYVRHGSNKGRKTE